MFKSFKKVISTIAAVAILASSAAAFAVDFPDVDKSASYAGAVSALTNLGIVDGDDNGKFNPENTVTRAEFTKMVVEAKGLGDSASASTYTQFTDAQGHWAAGYIQTGVAESFINGYDEKTFGPDDKVTYAQAVKMLVAAIGYELWSQQQGGYPAGYLSWGAQLNILDGVTGVNNDTALTRAQCAVLIYNTIKAPICKIVGYLRDANGEWYPDYQIMDGTFYNTNNQNYQSLLTEKHDAYVVRGRVMSIDKQDETVSFRVERADNFADEKVVPSTHPSGATASTEIANTAAADMKYIYSEAIVQEIEGKNEEYKMISINPYGKTDIVEIAVKDLDGTTTLGDFQPNVTTTSIYAEREDSVIAKEYKLATGVEVFVNDDAVSTYDSDGNVIGNTVLSSANNSYLDKEYNLRGIVTLIKETGIGTTTAADAYTKVMISNPYVGKVTRVKKTNDDVTIKVGTKNLAWTIDDATSKNVKFFKDGAEIEYTDVKEDDILVMSYDHENDIEKATWVDVQVSDKTVSGVVSRLSTGNGDDYAVIDGEKYTFDTATSTYYPSNMEINVEYTLYLDSMGVVVDAEEGETSKTVGIVLAVTYDTDEKIYTVKVATPDGEIKRYEAKDKTEAQKIDYAVQDAVNDDTASAYTDCDGAVAALDKDSYATKADRATAAAGRAIEYTVTSAGQIRFKKDMGGSLETGNAYREDLSKIGSYAVSETVTKVIDMDAYLTADYGTSIKKTTIADLEDEANYDVIPLDKNSDNEYRFVIITKGTTTLTPKSALAVVSAVNGKTQTADGEGVLELAVLENGSDEAVTVYYDNENETGIKEGAVIMYKVGADGYVEVGDLHVVVAPGADYDTTLAGLVALGADRHFATGVIGNGLGNVVYTDADTISVAGDSGNGKTKMYFGIVYSATAKKVEFFTDMDATAAEATSTVTSADLVSLTIGEDANVYTYDYSKAANKGIRVEAGAMNQQRSVYSKVYKNDDGETVLWNDNVVSPAVGYDKDVVDFGAEPMMVFVREYDDNTTDVVYFAKN